MEIKSATVETKLAIERIMANRPRKKHNLRLVDKLPVAKMTITI